MTAIGDMPFEWPDWMMDSLCWQVEHVDTFYPERGQSGGAAKAVCKRCPVVDACAEWALEIERHEPYSWGVFGGLTANERRKMLRAEAAAKPMRREIKCGTAAGYRAHFRHKTPLCEPCKQADKLRRARAA